MEVFGEVKRSVLRDLERRLQRRDVLDRCLVPEPTPVRIRHQHTTTPVRVKHQEPHVRSKVCRHSEIKYVTNRLSGRSEHSSTQARRGKHRLFLWPRRPTMPTRLTIQTSRVRRCVSDCISHKMRGGAVDFWPHGARLRAAGALAFGCDVDRCLCGRE